MNVKSIVYALFLCYVTILTSAFSDEIEEEPLTEFDRDHWAFYPVTSPRIPKVEATKAVRNPIDAFIHSRIVDANLTPLPEASPLTLLRRLKFDLLGLPPTLEEIDAFRNGYSDELYAATVDRFLASPRYGARWGQHWLDLARFAETDGFEHDNVRPNAWKYRDWVIASLNEDLPYDRFIQLQIAGDLLEPKNPEARIATAFCLSGPDMPDINSQEERRHILLNEMTSTVGSAVMGLQVGCAQCHDHKFDPISQADFYRMRAFFEPSVRVSRNKSVFTLSQSNANSVGRIMIRGDYRRPGAEIPAGFVRVTRKQERLPKKTQALDRVDLAMEVTRSDHPLTGRVIVNRVWQHHFGVGLSASGSDFGVMGTEPTHPELLDWMVSKFVGEFDWSLKRLHRLILNSAAFRRASHSNEIANPSRDTHNELLTRFPRLRLSGETVRDTLLAISDNLNEQPGGPGVMPPLPNEILKTLLTKQWRTTSDRTQHSRRSIYVFARRNLRYPIFDVFDRPDGNASCSMRDESTTATQSLFMLNSELSLRVAERLTAHCMNATSGEFESAIELAVLKCFGRPISRRESELFQDLRDSASDDDESSVLTEICLGLINANEFLYVD